MLDFIAQRLTDLGWSFDGAFFLLVDAIMLLFISASIPRAQSDAGEYHYEAFVDRIFAFLLLAIGSSLILGFIGILKPQGFLLLHGLLCTSIWVTSGHSHRERLRQTKASLRAAVSDLASPILRLFRRASWNRPDLLSSCVGTSLLAVLLFLLLVGTLAIPLNYDSNTYRLSRVALWVQDSGIHHFSTTEDRLNYMGFNCEAFMAWVVCFFPSGYPLANLPQWLGGIACIACLREFTYSLRYSRAWRLATLAWSISIPCFGLQFLTTQSDLFTAGLAYCAIVYGLRSLSPRATTFHWIYMGIAFGAAIGAKGTMLYWAPGLALACICWFCSRKSLAWVPFLRGLAIAGAATLPFGAPSYILNVATYGNPFGPKSVQKQVHGDHYTSTDLRAYYWQLLEPSSNHWPIRELIREEFQRADQQLDSPNLLKPPQFQPYLEAARSAFGLDEPNEDLASFGALNTLLFALGLLVAYPLADSTNRGLLLGFIVAAILFFPVFIFFQSWTPHKFRYFVLVCPILTLLALEAMRGVISRAVIVRNIAPHILGLCGIALALHLALHSIHHGFLTVLRTERSPHFGLRSWSRQAVADRSTNGTRIGLALGPNRWTAPMIRQAYGRSFIPTVPHRIARFSTYRAFLNAANFDAVILNSPISFPKLEDLEIKRFGNGPAAISVISRETTEKDRILFEPEVFEDGWTPAEFTAHVQAGASSTLDIMMENASPISRRVEFVSSQESKEYEVAPNHWVSVQIRIAPPEAVKARVTPPFVPSKEQGTPDTRTLGLRLRRDR